MLSVLVTLVRCSRELRICQSCLEGSEIFCSVQFALVGGGAWGRERDGASVFFSLKQAFALLTHRWGFGLSRDDSRDGSGRACGPRPERTSFTVTSALLTFQTRDPVPGAGRSDLLSG